MELNFRACSLVSPDISPDGLQSKEMLVGWMHYPTTATDHIQPACSVPTMLVCEQIGLKPRLTATPDYGVAIWAVHTLGGIITCVILLSRSPILILIRLVQSCQPKLHRRRTDAPTDNVPRKTRHRPSHMPQGRSRRGTRCKSLSGPYYYLRRVRGPDKKLPQYRSTCQTWFSQTREL